MTGQFDDLLATDFIELEAAYLSNRRLNQPLAVAPGQPPYGVWVRVPSQGSCGKPTCHSVKCRKWHEQAPRRRVLQAIGIAAVMAPIAAAHKAPVKANEVRGRTRERVG